MKVLLEIMYQRTKFVSTDFKLKLLGTIFRCQFIKRQNCHHIGTSQLICRANQLTSFYMMTTLAFNELTKTGSEC